MTTAALMSKASSAFYKAGFQLKKHSPEILVVTGVIGTVVSAVMACRATTKVSDILEETKETIDIIHEGAEKGEIRGKEYTQEDAQKDLTITYVQTGLKFVKLYAPSVILGTLSLTSILASNNILRKRCGALAAAYATIDNTFKEYRGRVIERFGEVVDKELRYNIKKEKIESTVTDPETGKEKKVKETIEVTDVDGVSEYSRFFDEFSNLWEKDPEYNLMFLRRQQQYANDKLIARGYLFLNEVYEMLGLEPSRAGQVVGWLYRPGNEKFHNYVDFGIYNIARRENRKFVNGIERSILLDFNIDGNVLDQM